LLHLEQLSLLGPQPTKCKVERQIHALIPIDLLRNVLISYQPLRHLDSGALC